MSSRDNRRNYGLDNRTLAELILSARGAVFSDGLDGYDSDDILVLLAVWVSTCQKQPYNMLSLARAAYMPRSNVMRSVERLKKSGLVRTVKVGRQTVVILDSLDAWVVVDTILTKALEPWRKSMQREHLRVCRACPQNRRDNLQYMRPPTLIAQ